MTIAKKTKRASAKSPDGQGSNARTILYVHGVGNKPPEPILRCQWDKALMGFGLGERSRMAYWCQADRHGPPTGDSCASPDAIGAQSMGERTFGARALEKDGSLEELINTIGDSEVERDSLRRVMSQMQGGASKSAVRASSAKGVQAQGVEEWDVPDFVTRWLTGLFLKDVRDFVFDETRRERMRRSLRDRVLAGGGPFVVIAHSQGTMIAWSVLQELSAAKIQVPLFVTLGCPLGLAEVRGHLRRIAKLPKHGMLPVPACVTHWQNFYDPKDIVTQGEGVTEYYRGDGVVQDNDVRNPDRQRDPHSATGYLRLSAVRQAVRDEVELQRFQQVAPFTLAADAVRDFEHSARDQRRPLLVELTDPVWAKEQRARRIADAGGQSVRRDTSNEVPTTSDEMAEELRRSVREIVDESVPDSAIDFRKLRRYVSVRLTRDEAERLASSNAMATAGLKVPPLYRIWRNAKKYALLETSIHTVQASAAHRSYEALGQGIHWAVLDSGCTSHPHFNTNSTIVARFDCTLSTDKPVAEGDVADGQRGNTVDNDGHGTHVAGIIAGQFEVAQKGRAPRIISGVSPQTKLHIYKVLDDEGEGDDSWIIKALDHIATLNEGATTPVVAGVNLSLGGPFDQGVFGCGHTPLCDELRRLWRQGVVVVLAAGNEGFARLISGEGELGINLSYSIGDPANLDEAIAVGAVHKERPHTYGVSHFSSRGPTADGRSKPDCVAPGEQILSCRHRMSPKAATVRDLYMKLDGTSMAAPHVSGVIACFLSRRREFVGSPDKVKEILLKSCTDLGRDRQLQGAGLPNLIRMLVQT